MTATDTVAFLQVLKRKHDTFLKWRKDFTLRSIIEKISL